MELAFFNEAMRIKRENDPLYWWRENCLILPKMSVMAKNILGTPATSVPSERIFSKAGELISSKRSSLKKETVDMVIFLNKNIMEAFFFIFLLTALSWGTVVRVLNPE